MWVCTEHGYFSAVADRTAPTDGDLWVRSRAAADLERVRSAGYDTGPIIGMVKADYPYRVRMSRTEWGRYVADQAGRIDYTNFKDRIHRVDHSRADIYMGVWHELTRIENADWKREGVAVVNGREAARG